MKSKYIYILLFLCIASVGFAQNKLFDKYAEIDNVTSVYISEKMFQMMPSMKTEGLDLAEMRDKVKSLQILSSENKEVQERMRKDFTSLINSQHEELMRVKDGKTKATFYVKQKGEIISEMIMIADTQNEGFTIIMLLGNFTLKDIQSITNGINK